MAEFTEVMRQARRMCETFRDGNCSKCPIGDAKALECGITVTSGMDYKEVERRVMQWAAEHPEPVYPSWKEGWKQLFPEADIRRTLCPEVFGDEYKCDWCHDDNDSCDECLERPIPAEVAEKLGVKPTTTKYHAIKHNCDNCKYERRKSTDEPCVRCNHCIDFVESILPAPELWEAAK